MLDQLKSLGVFATVVEEHSFRRAGEKLGLSPSVISHHISKLEKELGAGLLLRSTRSLALTAEGKELYASASAMMRQAKKGVGAFVDRAEDAIISFRIAMPNPISVHPVFEKILRFSREQPGTHLNIVTSERTADLIKDRFDIAIRMGILKDSELKSRKIGEDERLAVVSPKYVKKFGQPNAPQDFFNHFFIRFSPVAIGFNYRKTGGKPVNVTGTQIITTDSMQVAKQMAISGMGIVGVPACTVKNELADGSLLRLLPDWEGQKLGIYAVWAENMGFNPVHRRFMDYITAQ